MTRAASVIRYVDAADNVVLEEEMGYEMPSQTDWMYIDDTDYKVYDVVHTAFPERGRMVSTVFVWAPDPLATDAHLDMLHSRAVAARGGDRVVEPPMVGTCGEQTDLMHDRESLATVTVSAYPSAHSSKYEGLHIKGRDETTFVVSDIARAIDDGDPESGIFLFDVEDAANGASMADVKRNLHGQRDNARTRVLDNEGSEAYEELMEDMESQES